MNIFMLDSDPKKSAEYHCDKHVVKMMIEYAQLLSTAHRITDNIPNTSGDFYKTTHANHPSAIWTRESLDNYVWVYELWRYLQDEYNKRYSKIHKSWDTLNKILADPPENICDTQQTPLRLAITDSACIIPDNPVESYRNYYRTHKRHIASWKTQQPFWYY